MCKVLMYDWYRDVSDDNKSKTTTPLNLWLLNFYDSLNRILCTDHLPVRYEIRVQGEVV